MMSRVALGPLLACALLVLAGTIFAIHDECSACKAVAHALHDRMRDEKQRQNVEHRTRLDSQGNRVGNVVPYFESEARLHDLINGDDGKFKHVCNTMNKYILAGHEDRDLSKRQWVSNNLWIDHGGASPGDMATQSSRLRKWCWEFIDDAEDGMLQPLSRGDLSPVGGGAPPREVVYRALCSDATPSCPEARLGEEDWAKLVADDKEYRDMERDEEFNESEEL